MFRETGDLALIASVLTHLGFTFLFQGNLEQATATSEEAAAMFREQKHTSYLADALNTLGWVALLRGDSERARALYAESIQAQRDIGAKLTAPENLIGLCGCGSESNRAGGQAVRGERSPARGDGRLSGARRESTAGAISFGRPLSIG
jgi:tetratricopeptide (TPR) repeat protein